MKHIFDLKVLQYRFSTLCFNECDEVINNIDKMKHIFDLQVLQYEMNKVYLEINNLNDNIDSIKMSTNKWIEHVKDFAKKNSVSYGCAISMPECKASYKTGETQAKPVKKIVRKKREEETNDVKYFIKNGYNGLYEIMEYKGKEKQNIVVKKYTAINSTYDSATGGTILKFDKNTTLNETLELNKSILNDDDVVLFKSFDFDKSIKVYFTDRANYKGIKSEYVDDVPIPAPVKKDKPVSAPV